MVGHSQEDAQLVEMEHQEKKRNSGDSGSSASTTSLVFERIGERADAAENQPLNGHSKMVTPKFPPRGDGRPYADDEYTDRSREEEEREDDDVESGPFLSKPMTEKETNKSFRRLIWIVGGVFIGAWILALVLFLGRQAYKHSSEIPHDPAVRPSGLGSSSSPLFLLSQPGLGHGQVRRI